MAAGVAIVDAHGAAHAKTMLPLFEGYLEGGGWPACRPALHAGTRSGGWGVGEWGGEQLLLLQQWFGAAPDRGQWVLTRVGGLCLFLQAAMAMRGAVTWCAWAWWCCWARWRLTWARATPRQAGVAVEGKDGGGQGQAG